MNMRSKLILLATCTYNKSLLCRSQTAPYSGSGIRHLYFHDFSSPGSLTYTSILLDNLPILQFSFIPYIILQFFCIPSLYISWIPYLHFSSPGSFTHTSVLLEPCLYFSSPSFFAYTSVLMDPLPNTSILLDPLPILQFSWIPYLILQSSRIPYLYFSSPGSLT